MSRPKGEDQFNRKRLRYSYLSVVVSIGLVLFVLGVMMTLLYQARTLTEELKENFTFTLFLTPEATEAEREALQTEWSMAPEVRQIVFVSKEEAAAKRAATAEKRRIAKEKKLLKELQKKHGMA